MNFVHYINNLSRFNGDWGLLGGMHMKKINVAQVIADSKFNRFHFSLLAWCFLIILFDGYDLVVYGTVVPVLIEEWGLTTVQAGAIGSYGLFGMMFGAIILGILADRIGRKKLPRFRSYYLAYLQSYVALQQMYCYFPFSAFSLGWASVVLCRMSSHY